MGGGNLPFIEAFLGMETTTNIFLYICSNSKEKGKNRTTFQKKGGGDIKRLITMVRREKHHMCTNKATKIKSMFFIKEVYSSQYLYE